MPRNQALTDRARNALVGLNSVAAAYLQSLIDDYEQADQMSNVPLVYLADKPARVREQVMSRVAHWSMKRADVGRALERYLRKNT